MSTRYQIVSSDGRLRSVPAAPVPTARHDTPLASGGRQAAAAVQTWVDEARAHLHDFGEWDLLPWRRTLRPTLRGKKRAAGQALENSLQPRALRLESPPYRAQGWQIGSGRIASTARQLVGLRLKGPGRHWSEAGALAVTPLRAWSLHGRWHQFWETWALNC